MVTPNSGEQLISDESGFHVEMYPSGRYPRRIHFRLPSNQIESTIPKDVAAVVDAGTLFDNICFTLAGTETRVLGTALITNDGKVILFVEDPQGQLTVVSEIQSGVFVSSLFPTDFEQASTSNGSLTRISPQVFNGEVFADQGSCPISPYFTGSATDAEASEYIRATAIAAARDNVRVFLADIQSTLRIQ